MSEVVVVLRVLVLLMELVDKGQEVVSSKNLKKKVKALTVDY